MTILIKTPEGLSDIILNLVIVDVPGGVVGCDILLVFLPLSLPCHQPDELIETDLPVTVLVYLADHLLKFTT